MPLTQERRDELRRYWYRSEDQLAANHAQFDRAILTLSSGFLALSIAFINELVPLAEAAYLFLLILSWVCFMLAIISTIVAYFASNKALEHVLDQLNLVFAKDDDSALEIKGRWSRVTRLLNYFSGGIFVTAIILIFLFVFTNLASGAT